jgi:hypothetical protein
MAMNQIQKPKNDPSLVTPEQWENKIIIIIIHVMIRNTAKTTSVWRLNYV